MGRGFQLVNTSGDVGVSGRAHRRSRNSWRFDLDVAEFVDQGAGPAINILVFHQFAHAMHAATALFGAHVESDPYGLGHFIRVIRIDENGIAQFI